MYKEASILLFNCETSLHAGSGDAGTYVDLPIQREKHTGIPKIESSSLKGAIRESAEEKAGTAGQPVIDRLFGKDQNPDHASAIGFTDARLLFFPVKSVKGVMAWITCSQVLRKFEREVNMLPGITNFQIDIPDSIAENQVAYAPGSDISEADKVILEEYTFEAIEYDMKAGGTPLTHYFAEKLFPAANTWLNYWHNKMKTHLVLVHNDVFRDFVLLYTEVVTRNKIDNKTGTVQKGALFTEEYLPQESVLYSIAVASDEFKKGGGNENAATNMNDLNTLLPDVFQLGGNATIGKGILKLTKI